MFHVTIYTYIFFCHIQGYFSTFWLEKLGQNIPITMICPGPVQTNFLSEAYTEKLGEVSSGIIKIFLFQLLNAISFIDIWRESERNLPK